MTTTTLRIGFVPLVDCAVPVVAQVLGLARAEGLDLRLEREASWAAVRDKLAYGLLDGAHILAGLPLAATAGAAGLPPVPMIAPMALGLGGNGITVSNALYQRMLAADPEAMAGPRSASARALGAVIAADRAAGRAPLSLAHVFPFSSHHFELRRWLAAGGIDPDRDVNLATFAPPRMVEGLRMGWIDGYCVGEPWNLRAVAAGHGAIVATKADIWPQSPEKVLGLRADWAAENGAVVAALIRALVRAAAWCDAPENRGELATLLAEPRFVGGSVDLLRAALGGRPVFRPGSAPEDLPHRHVFFRWQATFPWLSQGDWLTGEMTRWGYWPQGVDAAAVVRKVYRPDLYRAAVAPLGLALPEADALATAGRCEPYEVPAAGGGHVTVGPDALLGGPAGPAGG
jgi:NitT/TauT family transport system ATP-binding protein/nitrate/nitrite transport system substrate-binding protein